MFKVALREVDLVIGCAREPRNCIGEWVSAERTSSMSKPAQQETPTNRNLLIVAAILLGLGAAYAVLQSQDRNQIVRPNQDGPAAPVVPVLPAVLSELRRAKTVCEERGQEFHEQHAKKKVKDADVGKARDLYTNAKADLDACIDYLRAGLLRRFVAADWPVIKQRLEAAGASVLAFQVYALETLRPGQVESGPSIEAIVDGFMKWLGSTDAENQAAIDKLREDLAELRLKDWSALK